ncbi:MAG: DUF1631 family protein [Halioglobus sp.]|nr:DUF1631 family protein [Halioglobus sp.]
MLDRYGEPAGVGGHAHPMQHHELLGYLKNIDNFSLSPWVALAEQTEAIGDPATPSREEIAILRWLGKALELWEKQSPLEGRVAAQVRRLKPLAAALAVTDPSFLQPGAHPLHQLLDNIQARAIGWQARLDRVGTILEQQVTRAVDESRKWFDNPSTDLAAVCAEFASTAERDQARAQRMIQRVVEAEAGKAKTAAAKREAAQMINAALERHPAPEEIGGFLKGPWYTSAQLLLLKFGADSEQWEKMSATTRTLLDSFQHPEDADEARRQHIFEVVTQLPKEMRRWLLSLHHDTEAVNESMGLVEFAHLRILRRQPLELLHIPPIAVESDHLDPGETPPPAAAKNWQEGQWFNVETGKEGALRVQLVLKVEPSQQLLFTNMAGIKVLQLSFTEFQRLASQGKVQTLSSGTSFSLCLGSAVGVDSVEILDALASALAQTPIEPAPAPAPTPAPPPGPDTPPHTAPAVAPPPVPATDPTLESLEELTLELESAFGTGPEPELEPDFELELDLDAELGSELDDLLQPDVEPGPDTEAQQESQWLQNRGLELELDSEPNAGLDAGREAEPPPEPRADPATVGAAAAKTEPQPAAQPARQAGGETDSAATRPAPEDSPALPTGDGYLIDQAQQIKARGGYFTRRDKEPAAAPEIEIEEIIAQPAADPFAPADPAPADDPAAGHDSPAAAPGDEEEDASLEFLLSQAGATDTPAEAPPPEPAAGSAASPPHGATAAQDTREVNLPMGAWLGFHDGETPLMARLAVYDLENDHYIFVNRKGVKMRQVSRLELLHLIDNELVDILETNSSFRNEVTAVRKQLDHD